MVAAGKSQELIQQLLVAEKQAEDLISQAKKNRTNKLKQAKDAAEDELKEFRGSEETKFQKEVGSKAGVDPAADLKTSTAREIQQVQTDYNMNKDKAIQYITSKVLDVPLGLTETQKQALKGGQAL